MPTNVPEGYQWYFAYGSNNSYEQLLRRLGHVDPYYFGVGPAIGGEDENSATAKETAAALKNFAGVTGGRCPTAPPAPSIFTAPPLSHSEIAGDGTDSPPLNYPPLAVRVVLVPNWFFVIDAPSATVGLGYANLRPCGKVSSTSTAASAEKNDFFSNAVPAGDPIHTADATAPLGRSAAELGTRPPYAVAVAYLLSNAQLLMMDKYENAPDKYRRRSVRGLCLKGLSSAQCTSDASSISGGGVAGAEEKEELGLLSPAENGCGLLPPYTFGPPPASPLSPPATNSSSVVSVPRDASELAAIEAEVSRIIAGITVDAGISSSHRAIAARLMEAFVREHNNKETAASVASATSSADRGDAVVDTHLQQQSDDALAGLALRTAHRARAAATATLSTVGSVVSGVAYVYASSNERLREASAAEEKETRKTEDATANTNNSEDSAKDEEETMLLRPSSSYMSRILEGSHFFGPSLVPSPPSSPTAAADTLLALYVNYLQSIEISQIPSPRALLRAAGKV